MNSFSNWDEDWRCRESTTKVWLATSAAFTEEMERESSLLERRHPKSWAHEGDVGIDVVSTQVPNSWARSQVVRKLKIPVELAQVPSQNGRCELKHSLDATHPQVKEMWSMRRLEIPFRFSAVLVPSMFHHVQHDARVWSSPFLHGSKVPAWMPTTITSNSTGN